jgi:hypothetical protein
VKEEDLEGIGMTRPEMRRLKKFYKKEHPQGTFGKLKKVSNVFFKKSSQSVRLLAFNSFHYVAPFWAVNCIHILEPVVQLLPYTVSAMSVFIALLLFTVSRVTFP